MSWTACYDDECYTHISDKQGLGWFPTRKSRSVCFTHGGPTDQPQEIVYPDGHTDSSKEDSNEESSEEGEVSENEGLIAEEQLGGRTTGQLAENDVIHQVLRLVVNQGFMVFLYHGEEQYVNKDKLCELYDQIRVAAISLPTVPGSTNYARIVQERPPIRSNFTRRGGYATLEGIVICRTLRSKVKALQEEYADEVRVQQARTGVRFQPSLPTLGRGSLFGQDMAAQPLIERQYMIPMQLPTPSPSLQEQYTGESG
jgi:hypothetical protein